MRPLRDPARAWALALLFAALASAQKAPFLEVFAEGGGSFLSGGSGQPFRACPLLCTPAGCLPCPASGPATSSFSKTGRLFAGARLRFTQHDALEASYSFSPNHLSLATGSTPLGDAYNRFNLVAFNYVRYLWARTPIQPFATAGLGASRFSGPVTASAVVAGLLSASNGFEFTWNVGGGTDLVLRRYFALRLELRDYMTGQPGFLKGTSYNIVPSAGIVFRFM